MAKKIIICDDEEGIRAALKLTLEDHYDLIVIETPEACLEALKSNHEEIGLVMLDIKMPRINGLELLKEIKSNYPGIPVVMVTGYLSVDLAAGATKTGADGYVIKPFKVDEILEMAKQLMS